MNYEQMLLAVMAICPDACLRLRGIGSWYVSTPGVEIGGDGLLSSSPTDGKNPDDAVRDLWKQLTDLKPNQFIVINAMTAKRRELVWNGFMWADRRI